MNVLLLAALGVAVVLVTILWFRLHPMLGLLLGSLFLLVVTPAAVRVKNELSSDARAVLQIVELPSAGGRTRFVQLDSYTLAGDYQVLEQLFGGGEPDTDSKASVRLVPASPEQSTELGGFASLDAASLPWFRVEDASAPFSQGQKLVPSGSVEQWKTARWTGLGARLADGFTKTFRKLGIPVAMAAIIGICMLESGAASRLVAAIMALFGTRGTAPALTVSGFVLGIPVYFDNVFYLLLPLAKAVGRRRPEQFLLVVMAIIVGASMAHSLVPPTPGPLFVADQIGVSVGMMMIGGFVVGSIAASVGFSYGVLCNRFIQLSPDQVIDGEVVADEAGNTASGRSLPLWLAALPIGLPIALLGGSEIVEYSATNPKLDIVARDWFIGLRGWTSIVNDPSLIFIGAALTAILILRAYGGRDRVAKSVARGVSDAGTIILLTSAGGAFGAALQQMDIANAIGQQFTGLSTPWGILCTAFGLTTIIRAAQGSATVAMLTSSSIIAPVMLTMDLPFHPLYVALAIGCGSKPLPWMNDSGFWQVATMTGMTTTQTLKTFSVALTLMGLTGFIATALGAWLLPLV